MPARQRESKRDSASEAGRQRMIEPGQSLDTGLGSTHPRSDWRESVPPWRREKLLLQFLKADGDIVVYYGLMVKCWVVLCEIVETELMLGLEVAKPIIPHVDFVYETQRRSVVEANMGGLLRKPKFD